MKRLAIIPARGGSKRIPMKNIRNFQGKPIIAYSIEATLASGLFDEIMVSTDDIQIAEVAKQYGANVPFMRSQKNSDDISTTTDVLLEVLDCYETFGQVFDQICCVYATAPFVNSQRLKQGYELLKTENYSTVLTVLRFGFPIQRAVNIDANNKVNFISPVHQFTRSQDLTETYHDCGQFYWMNVSSFKKNKNIWTENVGAIVLSEFEAQDIDTPMDWEMAELKYKIINNNHE